MYSLFLHNFNINKALLLPGALYRRGELLTDKTSNPLIPKSLHITAFIMHYTAYAARSEHVGA